MLCVRSRRDGRKREGGKDQVTWRRVVLVYVDMVLAGFTERLRKDGL